MVERNTTSLENRFGPLGPTRVQIPPPPLTTRVGCNDAGSSKREAGVQARLSHRLKPLATAMECRATVAQRRPVPCDAGACVREVHVDARRGRLRGVRARRPRLQRGLVRRGPPHGPLRRHRPAPRGLRRALRLGRASGRLRARAPLRRRLLLPLRTTTRPRSTTSAWPARPPSTTNPRPTAAPRKRSRRSRSRSLARALRHARRAANRRPRFRPEIQPAMAGPERWRARATRIRANQAADGPHGSHRKPLEVDRPDNVTIAGGTGADSGAYGRRTMLGDLGDLEVGVDLGVDANGLAVALEQRDPVAEPGRGHQRGQSRDARASSTASSTVMAASAAGPPSTAATRSCSRFS